MDKKWRDLFEILDGPPARPRAAAGAWTCPACATAYAERPASGVCARCEPGWLFIPGKGVAVKRGTTLEGADELLRR
jgi:hypothetical protein